MNMALVWQSLIVLGQGMAGVFVVMGLLALSITLLNRLGNKVKGERAKEWF